MGRSVNQTTYTPQNYSASKPNKDFEKNIKNNHFELGMGTTLPGQYTSVTQSAHDHKGDASAIRSVLDVDRKNDLRASHFEYGADKVKMKSTMQSSYMNMGPSKAAFNDDKKRDLRNSHFALGDSTTADYRTNHDIQFRPHAFGT